jgi:tight adherence protein B
LRAGLTINAALEIAGRDVADPLGAEFRIVHEEQALGLPLRDALMNLLKRIPRDDMRFLTTALLLQKETGGNLVQILETVGLVMRERVRIRGQIKIYTAQARVSGWIVAVVPFLMYGLINLMNPQYEKLLFDDPIGRTVFYFGCVMWIIGILLIKKIVSIKV